MPGREWYILKSTITDDASKVKRIGHGDGGLGTVEYYEQLSQMVGDIINAGLVNAKGLVRYNAGAARGIQCMVTADGYGITATRYGGGVRIVIPDTVMLFSFRIRGDATWLVNNQIEITLFGGYGIAEGIYNTSSANSYHPHLTAVVRSQLMPTDPFVQRPHDAGGYDVFHLPITTAGTCISQIVGLSGDWEVMGQL